MSNLDPVAAAIAAANAEAAKSTSNVTDTALVTQQVQSSAVAPVVKGKALTMEDMLSGSLSVDSWLKATEDGLKIGESSLIESVEVSLDFTEGSGFILKRGIKAGNPAQYAYTTDGVTLQTGTGSWEFACAKMRAIDPKAAEYRSVDLPLRLLKDATSIKGKVECEAGKLLGHSTSTTNWKNFELLYKAVQAAGLMGCNVHLKITAEPRTNKAGNKWGVLKFEFLGEVAESE